MELNSELIDLITGGGLNVILFAIWYFTAKAMQKSYKTMQDQNMEIVKKMFSIMEADMKYHELLTGILTRIEIKIDSKE